MTKEEKAIIILKNEQPHCGKKITFTEEERYEAYNLAIKALEQEPCEPVGNSDKLDCISRQAAIDELDKHKYSNEFCEEHHIDWSINLGMAHIVIKGLPSVTPQKQKAEKVIKMREATPEERELIDKHIKSISKLTGVDFWDLKQEPKVGHWINDRCDHCGYGVMPWNNTPYCPKCGARMSEVSE